MLSPETVARVQQAVSLLLDKLSNPTSVNKALLLPVELIVSDSTAVPLPGR
jgi:DNA-binding LacI/PurR family transcriptional regulator